MSCFIKTILIRAYQTLFPSPRGDELFHVRFDEEARAWCFRPLAGMSCFLRVQSLPLMQRRFRPLAGMSCFSMQIEAVDEDLVVSVPSRG